MVRQYISPQFEFSSKFLEELMNELAFSNGLARVEINRREHYIDKTGKVIY
ncbi:hypothetical protein NIES4071_72350 [Calothrix sp. NIES-4071]|nr:hypothetical protein NIES4071_72350 [Calothrix sp. NIES-4071]BAZ61510.1 hypothetical protein NIES4105_72300 [Calothrix sp. NIES-4105]